VKDRTLKEEVMFVARLERVNGEYVITVPHDVVVDRDLHEGQVVSVMLEPLSDYARIEGSADDTAEPSWRLNEDAPTYRDNECERIPGHEINRNHGRQQ
jgi:hypothetical protein